MSDAMMQINLGYIQATKLYFKNMVDNLHKILKHCQLVHRIACLDKLLTEACHPDPSTILATKKKEIKKNVGRLIIRFVICFSI